MKNANKYCASYTFQLCYSLAKGIKYKEQEKRDAEEE